MTETPTAKRPLRRIAPLAAACCAALVSAIAAGRRRTRTRSLPDQDPADRHLGEDEMEALATAEGMPEVSEG
jgi:hypothetical protein